MGLGCVVARCIWIWDFRFEFTHICTKIRIIFYFRMSSKILIYKLLQKPIYYMVIWQPTLGICQALKLKQNYRTLQYKLMSQSNYYLSLCLYNIIQSIITYPFNQFKTSHKSSINASTVSSTPTFITSQVTTEDIQNAKCVLSFWDRYTEMNYSTLS